MDEREFELVNIIGADLGANQRDLSRLMNLSLGMVNMLIRRLISKGYIRIKQLNKRKVEYILTPKGIAEKMRKSVMYTLKTINSISLLKEGIKEVIKNFYERGERKFYILGKSDLPLLIEMVTKDMGLKNCQMVFIDQTPSQDLDGVLLICKEDIEIDPKWNFKSVDVIKELSKDNSLMLKA